MDDAYIHLIYAENLAVRGQLFFNDPTEQGVGASSIFLDQLQVFHIDRERWLMDYLPVVNSQATVTVYNLSPKQ